MSKASNAQTVDQQLRKHPETLENEAGIRNLGTIDEPERTHKPSWVWANNSDSCWKRGGPRQPYMAGRTTSGGTSLLLNANATEEMEIKQRTELLTGYDSSGDRLGIRINRADEGGPLEGRERWLNIGWCLANFGFRLLDKETYRIEKNEPGADPPYIIPLNGRRTSV